MISQYVKAETFTGGFARALIEKSGLTKPTPEKSPLVIFDNACGTVVVSAELYKLKGLSENMQITCGDISESMVASVQQRIKDEGWTEATAKLIDVQVCIKSSVIFQRRILIPKTTRLKTPKLNTDQKQGHQTPKFNVYSSFDQYGNHAYAKPRTSFAK